MTRNNRMALQKLLNGFRFNLLETVETGLIFCDVGQTCIIVDCDIDRLQNFRYVDYTSQQNALFHRFDRVLRFSCESGSSLDFLQKEIHFFLSGGEDVERVRRFGADRAEQEIDPTRPEALFEDAFIEAFGESLRGTLHREFSYIDAEGKNRFIDYVLFTSRQKFAIELNGEAFHHPCCISPARYRSQLFKQNSLSLDGFKVFRWSQYGMQDREKFIQELQLFLGSPSEFIEKPHLKAPRQLATLKLHEHQQDMLTYLNAERSKGRTSFLVVLPTGTGKTEIFIKDIERLKQHTANLKVLILVPSRNLREQTIARLQQRIPEWEPLIGEDLFGRHQIVVQTYAFLHRHYFKLSSDAFDYLVVDEAHHAAAVGLKRVLEHFNPRHLLGVTATPERFDQRSLEEIFGEYESPLSLQQAVVKGLVPPVRCFRIRSNVDLSAVRFNGREYVQTDLQRTLQVPSRDTLIAETLQNFFSGPLAAKQGVVFCVDIQHAGRMATCLNQQGLSALAVAGRDRPGADDALRRYRNKEIRFLCACDLLTEGWDAPQTSILVMARPTFSKVLYTQQLGRGLRHYPGKEALYVIDVVDNYGAKLLPMSLHALLGIDRYCPFADLIAPEQTVPQTEIVVLDGLFEGIRRIEPVDIFTFENLYGDYLNEEQLARELFVSTGTVKSWLRNGRIRADYSHPFGRSMLHFFAPEKIVAIRTELGLSDHTAATRKKDFFEFLANRDYTYSYKIIFLLAFLRCCNQRKEAQLPDLLQLYQRFYQQLLKTEGRVDRETCPYNSAEYLADEKALQRSMLANPFEKFERKRFFYQCRDLNYIALDTVLTRELDDADYAAIQQQLEADLHDYCRRLAIDLPSAVIDCLLPEAAPAAAEKIVFVEAPDESRKFNEFLPYYPLEVAAGAFLDSELPIEPESWVPVRDLSVRKAFDPSMFVLRIQGHSMEPTIADGSYCVFSTQVAGSRQGRIVLARYQDLVDEETGAAFTVKRYSSSKRIDHETEWRHEEIILRADNPVYPDIVVPEEEAESFAVVAFFIEVVGPG